MNNESTSQRQIFKSTGIIGGAKVLTIIIGIVRVKVVAVLLGPTGIGVMSLLQATIDLVRNATGLGINISGVRDIADSAITKNAQIMANTVTILRRWAVGTGVLGLLVTVSLSFQLSNYSFGNDDYALSIAYISIILLFNSISASQITILQGLRKMRQIAKSTIYGSLLSVLLTIPVFWWFGSDGIVLALLIGSLITLFVSWMYTRKIDISISKLSFTDTFKGGLSMAKLGSLIVVSGFVATATMYAVRSFIASENNVDAVGYFQAAWMISNVYMGIVLNAMLADFLPSLSAISKNNLASNKLINEQMEVALLIGSPLIVLLISFSEPVINILYSQSFSPAIQLLQWQMLGAFFVFVSWPIGVMFLAKNKGIYSVIINSVWSMSYYIIITLGWNRYGFNILGIAYFVSALVNLVTVYFCARFVGNYSFSSNNIKHIFTLGAIVIISLINGLSFCGLKQYMISSVLFTFVAIFCFLKIARIIDLKGIYHALIGRL